MLRLSRGFGKREKFAAVHPVDFSTSDLGTPGLDPAHRLPNPELKVNSCSADGPRSVRTRIEHDPQRDGEALDIDALVPGKLQRNAL
jgi:hypothetical protein